MRVLGQKAPALFDQRSEELAYLANVLVSGCTLQQRRFRPIEAVDAVIATCSLGLGLVLESERPNKRETEPARGAAGALRRLSADGLFRLAWQRLYQDGSDAAAAAAVSILERAATEAGTDDRAALGRAARELRQARAARSPWRARTTLDALIGLVDGKELGALSGLMDECPSLRGGLDTADERGPKRGGPGAPRFIGTPAELARARELLAQLGDRAHHGPARPRSRRR
jgi:hypothetical protein